VEVVADSGAIYALYDRADEHHKAVSAFLQTYTPNILIPTALLGEIGYMLAEWLGERALIEFLIDLERGAFTLVDLKIADVQLAREILAKYPRLKLGFCDACVMAMANRLSVNRILTADQRHFRVVKHSKGKAFVLLPWDLG